MHGGLELDSKTTIKLQTLPNKALFLVLIIHSLTKILSGFAGKGLSRTSGAVKERPPASSAFTFSSSFSCSSFSPVAGGWILASVGNSWS